MIKNISFCFAVISVIIFIIQSIYFYLYPKAMGIEKKLSMKKILSFNNFTVFIMGSSWMLFLYDKGDTLGGFLLSLVVGVVLAIAIYYISKYIYILKESVECVFPENLDGYDATVVAKLSKTNYIIGIVKDGKPKEMAVELSDSDIVPGDKLLLRYIDGELHADVNDDKVKRQTKADN